MPDKPQHADEYQPEQTKAARQACLMLALRLGSFLDDLIVVGGLVPSLLIDSRDSAESGDHEPHVGTADLDIGVSLALLEGRRYHELSEALRAAGFAPALNERGNPTSQRWESGLGITVDFLIPPTRDVTEGGRLQHLEPGFAAIVAPGLELAFQDRENVQIDERILGGERVIRTIGVCGPGAYVIMKALAFDGRGEPKDAYDLYYVLAHYGEGLGDVVPRVRPLLDHPEAAHAFDVLRRDFSELDRVGPVSVARFLRRRLDEEIQADVSGTVVRFLELLDQEL